MNKKLFGCIITICLIIIMVVPTFAYGKRCGYEGKCNADTTNCHNGTVYCDRHAAAYAREHNKTYNSKTCGFSGCYSSATKGSNYCSFHTCQKSGCNNKATASNGYCTTHKCKYSGCNNCAYYSSGRWAGYCNNHAWQLSGKNSTTAKKYSTSSYSTKKKTSSSSKKYEMPDCDDYEDYDDFMDDWDGCMPDESDAEDYWENW